MTTQIRILLAVTLVLLFALSACQSSPQDLRQEVSLDGGGSYRVVSVQDLQTMIENKDFTMINVHIPWQGDIPQTDLRLPFDQIEQNLEKLPAEKDAKILVYCLTSGMAKKSVQSLSDLGYSDIWMLDGGTTAWEEAGLSLIGE